jgi:hypothetical protein
MINELKNNSNLVTIQKWVLVNGKIFYWIIDNNGNQIDGFSKKYQALDAIKRWNLVRENKSIKVIR